MNVKTLIFAFVALFATAASAQTEVVIAGQTMEDDSKCCTCHGCPCGGNNPNYVQQNENCCCRWWCPASYIWTYPNQCCAGWTACSLNLWVFDLMSLAWLPLPGTFYALLCWSPPTRYRRAGGGCCESCCGGFPGGNCCGEGCGAWPCCTCCAYSGCCGGNPPLVMIANQVVIVAGYREQFVEKMSSINFISVGTVMLVLAMLALAVRSYRSKSGAKANGLPKAKCSELVDNLDEAEICANAGFDHALAAHEEGRNTVELGELECYGASQ